MTHRRSLASLVLLLVVVSGCGGSGSSASSSSTASSTPVPTATDASAAPSGTDTTPAIVRAVRAFLATLTAKQKSSISFAFSDTAQRQRWSNLPQGLFQRAGVEWGALSNASQRAWLTVMRTTLSNEGYQRVVSEWNADDALAASGSGGGNLHFGTQNYWIAIIGTPSTTRAWQWQWGGHHVTVNATVKGADVSLTPSFIGAQPATYDASSGRTVRPLGDIEDEATALVRSLDTSQRSKAVLGGTSIDLVLGPGQDGKTISSEGLPGSAMTASQKAAMLRVLSHYANLVNAEDAAARVRQLRSDLDQTYVAWYGPVEESKSIYFRFTGPHVVVEYSDQEMGGDPANHVHGIYRDPTDDYGAAFGAGLG